VPATSTPVPDSRLRWELSGSFPHPHWLAHVCSGLSDLGIAVLTGHAVRRPSGTWKAHLDVDVSRSAVPVSQVDPVALAAVPPRGRDLLPLRLTSAEVVRRDDGLVQLDVTAPDELGFLGRLLRRVALMTLHPVEVSVATRDGRVHDRLVLAGIGATVPGEEVMMLLHRVVSGLVVA
jgi:hypothetical protein